MDNQEKIICSAIYYDDGIVRAHQPRNIERGFVATGLRHCNCFATMIAVFPNRDYIGSSIQGFLTNTNRFVDRQEGAQIAFAAGQITEAIEELQSEDLY